MRRVQILERPDWREKVEPLGFLFHTTDGTTPYWNESAYYEFSAGEIERLEQATNELHEMCLQAVQHVIDEDRFADLKIPQAAVPAIVNAWEADPPAVYGRFDLAFNGKEPPKLLEYNADTPTALLEAAVIQWQWLQDRYPQADQFNSIWEGLVEKWRALKGEGLLGDLVYFAHEDALEDLMTVTLLRDTAREAGVITKGIHMGEIGWDSTGREFVDTQEYPMRVIFKLYPWEWLISDEFGEHVLESLDRHTWIEPIWKMILSNKGILPILWELFPDHPNLLPAFFDGPRDLAEYVRKPLLSREGANVAIFGLESVQTDGIYGDEGHVYQGYSPLPDFDGSRPVIGSWVIDGEARGIGIRESDGPITDNLSRFVPHLFG